MVSLGRRTTGTDSTDSRLLYNVGEKQDRSLRGMALTTVEGWGWHGVWNRFLEARHTRKAGGADTIRRTHAKRAEPTPPGEREANARTARGADVRLRRTHAKRAEPYLKKLLPPRFELGSPDVFALKHYSFKVWDANHYTKGGVRGNAESRGPNSNLRRQHLGAKCEFTRSKLQFKTRTHKHTTTHTHTQIKLSPAPPKGGQ